jgi:scyllo-inositol 2-dehydrogenase (NADP+)
MTFLPSRCATRRASTLGSYKKDRTDPQETQLLAGTRPDADTYGREQPGQEGLLTLADPAGHNRLLPPRADAAAPATYMALFDAVHQTIRHGQPYPVKEEELEWQLEIITS